MRAFGVVVSGAIIALAMAASHAAQSPDDALQNDELQSNKLQGDALQDNELHGDNLWNVYQIALRNDAAHRAAQAEFARAKLALPLAKSARYPALSTTAARNRAHYEDAQEDNDRVTARADWRVYDRGVNREIAQARLRVEQDRILFTRAQHELILRVAENYFRLLSARDNNEVARRHKASVARQLTFAEQRLAVGLGTDTDAYDAQARFQQATADEIQARNEIDNARYALKQVIGRLPRALAPLRADAPFVAPRPQSVDAWIARARAGNLALAAAGLDVQIAEEEIKKQRGARWPTLNLRLERARRLNELSRAPIANSNSSNTNLGNANPPRETSTASATLSWTLLDGGAIFLRAKQAGLNYTAAQQTLEQIKRQVDANVTAAYLEVVGATSRIAALGEAVRAGESALQAKEEGFGAGLTTNLDVLDAQRDLARLRTDYLSTRYAFILAVLRLEQIVGDLDEADVKRVNGWLTAAR